MPTYMTTPRVKVTLGSTEFENSKNISGEIIRVENGFDTATLVLSDYQSLLYPSVVTAGTAYQVDIKNQGDSAYTTVSKGVVRFPILPTEPTETIRLKCDGSGYGFGDTYCAQQYGTQSTNPTLNSLLTILTDASYGIVTKYVNKILGSTTDSGFAYTTTTVDDVVGEIPYLNYPYKPNNKALDDICDLISAINAGTAGPHWIVTTDDKLHVKLINGTQASWTKYYGDSQANATLVQGLDFHEPYRFEKMGPEANYVIYAGIVEKGDYCENNSADWLGSNTTISDESVDESLLTGDAASGQKVVNVADGSKFTVQDLVYLVEDTEGKETAIVKLVNVNELTMKENLVGTFHTADNAKVVLDNVRTGTYSIKARHDAAGYPEAIYPDSHDLALNIDRIGSRNSVPMLSFYVRRDDHCNDTSFTVGLWTWDGANYAYYERDIVDKLTLEEWNHVVLPIGTYYKQSPDWDGVPWTVTCSGMNITNWSAIDSFYFLASATLDGNAQFWIDGLSIQGKIIRVAKNSTNIAAKKVKMKVITDNIGKDDSLVASDHTGTMARMAYAELLRLQKTSLVGTVTTPMIKDALPGQWLHIHAKRAIDGSSFNVDADMRITKMTHTFGLDGFFTTFELTDDVTNSNPRPAFEDINKVWSAIRPEFQDRQACNIKVGDVDNLIVPLEKDYPSVV